MLPLNILLIINYVCSKNKMDAYQRTLVDQLRQRISNELPSRYDSDFNLLRWILAASRNNGSPMLHSTNEPSSASSEKLLNFAETALRKHLRVRKAMKLDENSIPNWDCNPMFQMRLIPRGYINGVDKNNRLIWWIKYKSLDLGGALNTISTGDIVRYHFYQYEEMLRTVMEHEERTGKMSGIHHIGDMDGFASNPFTLLFAGNGQLAYYATLFHWIHYPELVRPISFVNTPRWLLYVFRLVKSMAPSHLFDSFNVIDSIYDEFLRLNVPEEQIPWFYPNGQAKVPDTIQSRKVLEAEYYRNTTQKLRTEPKESELVSYTLNSGSAILLRTEASAGDTLSYFFKTDGEITFGVFYTPIPHGAKTYSQHFANSSNNFGVFHKTSKEVLRFVDDSTMVAPWLHNSAKLVPEQGSILCDLNGSYFIVFYNHNGWLSGRRTVNMKISLTSSKPGDAS